MSYVEQALKVQEGQSALESTQHTRAACGGTEHVKKTKAGQDANATLFSYVFVLLLQAMSIRQSTVFIQSKELENNAAAQEAQNRLDKSLQFESIPAGATTNKINQIQDANQIIAALREDIQNTLITLRQQSQVLMTVTNTNVNTLEQDASMDSGWLSTIQSVYQVINQISQPI